MYVYIVLLILLTVHVLLFSSQEPFISIFKKRRYYVENTSGYPLNYSRCVGMPLSESNSRLDNAPFYIKTFYDVSYTLNELGELLQEEISMLKEKGAIKTASVLITTDPRNRKQTIYCLFPEFDTDGEPVTSYAILAKNNRWYYMLFYHLFYNAGRGICLNSKAYSQCPGVPVRLRTKNYFFVKFFDYYIIPCGIDAGVKNGSLVKRIKQASFYAHYVLNSKIFPTISPYPDVSYMSELDTIKYGCETQLISQNGKYIMLLEQHRRNSSFGAYQVIRGNPYEACFSGRFVVKKELWRIPLSTRIYATFKLEVNYFVLIDYDRPIFKIIVNTPNTPIVLQLNNDGHLDIYDNKNAKIKTFTYQDILNAISGKPVDGLEVDYDALRDNLSAEKRAAEEDAARLREAEEQRLRDYYNKKVCPIGPVEA